MEEVKLDDDLDLQIRVKSAFNKGKLIISDGRDMEGIGFYKDEQPRQKIKSKVINILTKLWTTL